MPFAVPVPAQSDMMAKTVQATSLPKDEEPAGEEISDGDEDCPPLYFPHLVRTFL